MLIESKVRAEFDHIWSLGANPIRKARRFLSLERRLARLARHLANLGFATSESENSASRKLLWASSAKFLHFAQQAREYARQALRGRPPRLGFDYAPQAFATPNWSLAASEAAEGRKGAS